MYVVLFQLSPGEEANEVLQRSIGRMPRRGSCRATGNGFAPYVLVTTTDISRANRDLNIAGSRNSDYVLAEYSRGTTEDEDEAGV
jgi:hypothetical protein